MKNSRACPDNLVPRQSTDPHLRTCRGCRRELAVAQAFKREFGAYVGMEDLGYRVAAVVGAEVARSNRGVAPARRKRPGTAWYLLAASMVLVSIAAIAATQPALRIPWHSSKLSLANSPAAPATAPRGGPPPVAASPEQPMASAEAVDPPRAVPPPARVATSGPRDRVPTARDLFASATMARHDDNRAGASALYRELQRRYPTSAEALVSRVSFGRVLLDRLDDPGGALAQFDGYLAQTGQTTLAEEALFGRASALARLGRSEAERETWRVLLARYPSSVYADRARARMGSIQ